jgi:glycosyltransferase involved in cell wall biosynthesis
MSSVTQTLIIDPPLKRGNRAMRAKDYATAISCYEQALELMPAIGKTIAANLSMAIEKRNRTEYYFSGKTSVLDCGESIRDERMSWQGAPTAEDIALLSASKLFDEDWYVQEHQERLITGLSPVAHYLTSGWRDKLNPSLFFDGNWYCRYYPDVAESGTAPLLHYLRAGSREGRETRMTEDASERLAGNPETGYVVIERQWDRYRAWCAQNQDSDVEESRILTTLASATTPLPLISIIMPVYFPPLNFLDIAIESVTSQIYENWELCIYVDGGLNADLVSYLNSQAARDARIKILYCEENAGISIATNKAVTLATGEYITFLDQDDILRRSALAEFAFAIHSDLEVDILYSDDDKIDEKETLVAPQFKPDWAPVLLLSYMYLSHLFMVKREVFEALGGFRVGYEGSQDFDFALRASEIARKVIHIPKVLYHWRVLPGSTASSADAKPSSMIRGLVAVQDACSRRGINAEAYQPDWAAAAKVGMFSLRFRATGPSVTIIIPTRNRLDLLGPCIRSIECLTAYDNYKILIVDNDSDEMATLEYLQRSSHTILHRPSPDDKFNFAYLMNEAVQACDTEYVLLLNNDTEILRRDWLQQMVGYAQMHRVGAVGAKLYFPDNTIQHAGIVHGLYDGLAGPAFRNSPSYHHGYLGYTMVAREYSAVTAACLLTPRALFLELGGMNQRDFGVAYNDVDYCYRLIEKGYSCVYCPDAELTHFEGKSRGFKDNVIEISSFRKKYRAFTDAWYNPNLGLSDENFQIQPWRSVPSWLRRNPIRAVMVSHNLNHEGAPNSMLEMVRGLKTKGVLEPIVVSPEDGPLRAEYERAGIEVQIIDHPLRDAYGGTVYEENCELLANRWRLAGAELVYANTAQAFWAIDAAQTAGLSAVWNIRESEPWQSYYSNLPIHIRKRAYEAFTYPYRIVFVAQATLASWCPLNTRHNFTVIHNGLDLAKVSAQTSKISRSMARIKLGLRTDEIAVVLVGTICERKNQKILVDALALLATPIADRVRIFLVGDRASHYSDELHRAIGALPANKRTCIEVVPETNEPYIYYLAGDIAVCSSVLESYPRVVLEAMALGLPILATPVFGIIEQVREGVNAFLFSPDDPVKLAEGLEKLVSDHKLRINMGTNSKSLFQGLNQYEDMLNSYAEIMWSACLASSSSRHMRGLACAG